MARESIKLVSVNIELSRHLDLVRAFLGKEKPDIACLQEVREGDLQELAKELQMESVFAQMSLIGLGEYTEPPFTPYGVGILSALPMQDVRPLYYRGNEESAKKREFQGLSRDDPHPLLCATIKKGNVSFVVGTTHFTWTPNGEPDDLQRSDLKRLLEILAKIPEIILGGDFNAPRGREIFDTLAQHYKDNIPKDYATSIDANLHKDGEKIRGKSLMVDGLFTTPHYEVENVRLQDGVSDHMAVVAEIQRV